MVKAREAEAPEKLTREELADLQRLDPSLESTRMAAERTARDTTGRVEFSTEGETARKQVIQIS